MQDNGKAILKVRNLRVSFKTNTGTVKAVRGINFSLYRGRTLAIVGESGSGKSVTSKAILGILANNKIIEDGRIIYDGKDLLTLPEHKFTKIRGVKISMIFQDPLSALNPIMKVGKQLTEAMVLENKSLTKEAKKYVKYVKDAVKVNNFNSETLEMFNTACISLDALSRKVAKLYLDDVNKAINSLGVDTKDFHLAVKSLRDEEELNNELLNNYKSLFVDALAKNPSIIDILKECKKVGDGVDFAVEKDKEINEIIHYYASMSTVLNNKVKSKDDEVEVLEKVFSKNFRDLLTNAANIETLKYLNNLQNALCVCEEYRNTYLPENANDVNVKEAIKGLKQMKKALAACKDFFAIDADDIIDVHIVLMKKYLLSMVDADKQQAHLDETLLKYNVSSVFDLPAGVRTKEREVITSKEVYYQSIQNITNRLEKHIKEIIAKYPLADGITDLHGNLPIVIKEEEINGLITFFAKMVKQAQHSLTAQEAKERAIKIMTEVGIPDPERRFYQYPFEFSGGMRQRIVIAIALSGNPEILICDEPTTALDVTIQAQILELIQRLKEEKNLSIIFITHDLGVVANMADDIAVMYAGKIVEYGSVYDIFYDPRHPYTWALLSSMPDLDTKGRLDAIPGTPPNMLLPPRGDAFAARNSYAVALDYKQEPPFFEVSETHSVKTWLAHKDAIDVIPPKTVVERIKNSLATNPANKPTYTLKKNSVLEIIKGGKE